jgi:hypothetical protein
VRHLKVGIVDLVATERCSSVYARMMFPHFASIMPQAVAVWCAEAGHRVTFVCYTGEGDVIDALPADLDIVFICAFTHAALLAYAASAYYRSKGAITILGGPHARAYPAHARRYFDYVLGLTDRALIVDLLGHCAPERPFGRYLTCAAQPRELPSIRDRWPYLAELHRRAIAPTVALIGSLGCPYTCSFCVDAPIPYQPLDYDTIRNDLRFLLTRFRRPRVGWHDPNFGVRFDEYMDVIEEAVPSGSIEFGAETSLSLLSEPRLRRLKRNGFRVMISGIESWYDHGNKSRTGTKSGSVKMRELVECSQSLSNFSRAATSQTSGRSTIRGISSMRQLSICSSIRFRGDRSTVAIGRLTACCCARSTWLAPSRSKAVAGPAMSPDCSSVFASINSCGGFSMVRRVRCLAGWPTRSRAVTIRCGNGCRRMRCRMTPPALPTLVSTRAPTRTALW